MIRRLGDTRGAIPLATQHFIRLIALLRQRERVGGEGQKVQRPLKARNLIVTRRECRKGILVIVEHLLADRMRVK